MQRSFRFEGRTLRCENHEHLREKRSAAPFPNTPPTLSPAIDRREEVSTSRLSSPLTSDVSIGVRDKYQNIDDPADRVV